MTVLNRRISDHVGQKEKAPTKLNLIVDF